MWAATASLGRKALLGHEQTAPETGRSPTRSRLTYGSNSRPAGECLRGRPCNRGGLEVGFVNGRDTPELFLQEDPRMGTVFTNDQIS